MTEKSGWVPAPPYHSDHDDIVALRTRFEEWRGAHEAVHRRDAEQLVKDFNELQRRLDVLNHAHEEARRKEISFASKEDLKVQIDDVLRRIEQTTATLGITLPRETFDAAMERARLDGVKRDEQIAAVFSQVQGIAQTNQGSASGALRVQTLVFALFGAFGVVVGIYLALRG